MRRVVIASNIKTISCIVYSFVCVCVCESTDLFIDLIVDNKCAALNTKNLIFL